MSGLLIVAITVLLLVLALEPAHRRARREGWAAPGRPSDRDWDRVAAELRYR